MNVEKIKNLFRTKNTRKGSYSIAITAIVIAIIFVFNLIVGQLPQSNRQNDISDTNIYNISSTSKKLKKKDNECSKLYLNINYTAL